MCGPIAGLMGSMMSAVGSIMQGNAQAASLEAQAQFNNRQSSMEYTKGSYQIALQKRQEDRVVAGQQVGFSKGGINPEVGTGEDLTQATDIEAGLDRQAIRFGRDVTSSNYAYKAKIDQMNAGEARTAGMFGALSGIVGGFAKLGGNNFQMS